MAFNFDNLASCRSVSLFSRENRGIKTPILIRDGRSPASRHGSNRTFASASVGVKGFLNQHIFTPRFSARLAAIQKWLSACVRRRSQFYLRIAQHLIQIAGEMNMQACGACSWFSVTTENMRDMRGHRFRFRT